MTGILIKREGDTRDARRHRGEAAQGQQGGNQLQATVRDRRRNLDLELLGFRTVRQEFSAV